MVKPNSGIFFRVDGGTSVGMGHVGRCLWLARTMHDRYSYPISFLMNRDEVGISRVSESGWPVIRVDAEDLDHASIADALIIDLPGGVSAQAIRSLRERHPQTTVVLIDTNCSGCVEADLVAGPMQIPRAPSGGMRGERYEGPEYAILDPAFAQVQRPDPCLPGLPRVLVTMGGSDPCGLTLQTLRALDVMPEAFETTVALGPAFLHEKQLRQWLPTAQRPYDLRREKSLLGLMTADLAIFSFATTAYELAAAGLPAVALSISKNHAADAETFSQNGSIVNLGWFSGVSGEQIQQAVRHLLNDPARRLAMSSRGRKLVDGRGAERVAELIGSRIGNRHTSHAEGRIGTSQRT